MKVPQFSPWVKDLEYKRIKSCFTKNWYTEGPLSQEFRDKLLTLIGSKYGVFAPNGTLALYLALKALGIKPGDEVIVPSFTFIGSATAVEMCGGVPVFIDVNRTNFQIDIANAEKLLSKKTRAIMPVHIYGTIASMKPVLTFSKKHNLLVIEDAAQAIGVHRNKKHAGTFGDIGCFSFFADKTITTGEGGFVVTNSSKLYENMLYLRNQGRLKSGTFIHPEIGYNLRITDIQAAIGLVQLTRLPEIKKRKLHILKKYQEEFKDFKDITFFAPDKESEWLPFRVGILTKRAHELMEFLKKNDIEPRSFFYPLHKQPAFTYLKKNKRLKNLMDDSHFPNTLYAYDNGICLPTFPTLNDSQIHYIAKVFRKFFSS